MTSGSYENILMQLVIPVLHEHKCAETIVFMQDRAPPLIGRQVQRLLRKTIDELITARSFPNTWPARSSDLNPCDFWLWGYFKDRVYQRHVRSLIYLKTSIQRHVSQIQRELLRTIIDHAILRMQYVFEAAAAHIENIL